MDALILSTAISLALLFGHILPDMTLNPNDYQEKSGKVRTYQDLPEKEEFRQSYRLEPGTKVEISDISGILEIENIEGDTAEIYIVRSAKERKDLELDKIKVENNGKLFRIYTEYKKFDKAKIEKDGKLVNPKGEGHSYISNHHETRQRIYLKLPKSMDLSLNDISGSVEIGDLQSVFRMNDISGSVRIGQMANCEQLNDISGSVRIKRAINCKEIHDISGNIEIGLERLSNSLNIHDISGNVNLKFTDDVNADLKVRDVSGNVSVNLPNWTITKKQDRNNFDGRIGSGGTSVNISDISGAVRLTQQALN